MRRTEILWEVRKMRFEEIYGNWTERRLTQEEAAMALGVCSRTFRRYIDRYEEDGMEGLKDKRLTQASFRRAPVDEVLSLTGQYKSRYRGWNVKHFYSWYSRDGGKRSYTWVKNTLQSKGLVLRSKKRGKHRHRREPSPLPGMMIHQDGSRHEWAEGHKWDLIITMDDATNEHYSMFFVEEEGTDSSFQGIKEVILKKGLFSSLYTDRGSHYWNTPEAGGKVDKNNPTQFGRAMRHIGIEMIPAYSPEARGRCERAFKTHQDRLPKELAYHGITDIEEANRYLKEAYMPAYNCQFMHPAREQGTAFIQWMGANLDDILCEQHERTVSSDNCVSFEGKTLQIPRDEYRCNYIRVKVRVHCYADGSMAVFHGPRKLADYDLKGQLKGKEKEKTAVQKKSRHISSRAGKALRAAPSVPFLMT